MLDRPGSVPRTEKRWPMEYGDSDPLELGLLDEGWLPSSHAPAPRGEVTHSVPAAASIELANVLVSLLERRRAELRGHSAQVSSSMVRVGRHMGLSGEELYGLRLAGLLHDVGKTSGFHLTALNVAQYEDHRARAKTSHASPVRLFEMAGLPAMCVAALTHMYERVDGAGFPARLAGKDIPLGARLLAIAETYADLTANVRNPFRRRLTPKHALEVLGRYKGTVFDANLVDLFRVAALGGDSQRTLLGARPRVLLVDADAEETTVLELRLTEQGFEVLLCRSASAAHSRFEETAVDALIVEVDIGPQDGFALVEELRTTPAGAAVPVIFLTGRSDRASVDRGLALGAVDYILKPVVADVVVAKVHNELARSVRRRGPRGLSGSLGEMPLSDVLQVLSQTRKTGRLEVVAGGHVGEIQLRGGLVYRAAFLSARGAEAVYAMLRLTEGDFALDPYFPPGPREVHATTESLLLEGMRRLDEERDDLGATHVE